MYRFVSDTLCLCAVGHALSTARAAGSSGAALRARCTHCKQRSHHPTEFACTQCAFEQVPITHLLLNNTQAVIDMMCVCVSVCRVCAMCVVEWFDCAV